MIGLKIFLLVTMVYIKKVKTSSVINVAGNIGQSISVSLPFEHIIQVEIQDAQYEKLIEFSPSRLRLKTTKTMNNLPLNNISLFEDLRSPFSNQYRHLFKIKQFIIAFKYPNMIIIIKQTQNQMKLIKNVTLNEVIQDQLNYKIFGSFVLLLNKQNMFIIKQESLTVTKNLFFNQSLLVVRKISNNEDQSEFIVTQGSLYQIRFNQKIIETQLKANMTQINKFSSVKTFYYVKDQAFHQSFWYIDQQGLKWINQTQNLTQKLLFQQSGCYQMDILMNVKQIQVLLTCLVQGSSAFIRLKFSQDSNMIPVLTKKYMPYFDNCFSKKYFFYKQFVLSQERQTLDIFSVAFQKDTFKEIYIKNWIRFPGINAIDVYLNQNKTQLNIYSIQTDTILKQIPVLSSYSMHITSPKTLQGQFNILVKFYCQQQQFFDAICQQNIAIKVDIHDRLASVIEAKSINIGLIFLFMTTLLALVIICYHKYQNILQKVKQEFRQLTATTQEA